MKDYTEEREHCLMKLRIAIRIEAVLDYLIVLFVICRNYSMLSRDQVYNMSESFMDIMITILCLLSAINCIKKVKKVTKRDLMIACSATAVCFLSVLFGGKNIIAGLTRFTAVFFSLAMYFVTHRNHKQIWERFINVIFLMAMISLVLYFVGSIFKIIEPSRIAMYMYDGKYRYCNTYFGLQYESQGSQWLSFLGVKYRNCGFFIEAPMYNVLLCIAMAFELSNQKRKNIITILSITILTTMTTTGLVFLLSMIGVGFFTERKNNSLQLLKLLLFPIIIIILFLGFNILMSIKLQDVSGEASVSIRSDHLFAFMKMWIHRPLFGYGYMNADAFYKFSNYKQGYSVGLPALLGFSGVFVFLIYFVPFIRNTLYAFKNNREKLFFWIGSFICLLLTAVAHHPISIMIICYQMLYNFRNEVTGKA